MPLFLLANGFWQFAHMITSSASKFGSEALVTNNNPGVDITQDDRVRVQSKTEVSLGKQRVNLVTLNNESGGTVTDRLSWKLFCWVWKKVC
jgi:hypothetical protein